MQKIFHFDSPQERYKCEAAVVWCFDNRFELVLRKLLKHLGIVYFDPIRIAGGTKYLASADDEAGRRFVLEQIRISIQLHETQSVILMLHSDCGAYGGLAAFEGDADREARNHCGDLERAAACVKEQFPGLEVKTYFVNFEGVWEVNRHGTSAVKIA